MGKSMDVTEVRAWTIQDSSDLYHVEAWGDGYFRINTAGNLVVTPNGKDGPCVDLKQIVDDLVKRGVRLPVVLRFSDILADRVRRISAAFTKAIEEFSYGNRYSGVYPIKVNQERLVVEELVRFGRPYGLGLEAGSKPELVIALALQSNPDGLIICNGYKDAEYIELALMAEQLGRKTVIVIDRFEEVDIIVRQMRRLGRRAGIGVRTKLNARGAGRWADSGGDRSKFGLSAVELVRVVEVLRKEGFLEHLELLHFHIGSQITAGRAIKSALAEACRVYVELTKLGAPLGILDVGGGLAVDYDGSHSSFPSSSNYSINEYAADIVSAVGEICREAKIPTPLLVSESGRALTAHHSALIFDVLGVGKIPTEDAVPLEQVPADEHRILQDLQEIRGSVNSRNVQESFQDALQFREEAQTLFKVGVFDLSARARAEQLFWSTCARIQDIVSDLGTVPKELRHLKRTLADIYFCNFSIFQSLPDSWACEHLFPVLPIHRLKERPERFATLADLTCDSDGRLEHFIDLHDTKRVLELHELRPNEPYYIGTFLVGAYQEILGDLHNLFGDTHCVHISLDPTSGGYRIEEFEDGESIQEVLTAVSYNRKDLVQAVRKAAEQRVRDRRMNFEDSAELLRRYEQSLNNYTYLGQEFTAPSGPSGTTTRNGFGRSAGEVNPPA